MSFNTMNCKISLLGMDDSPMKKRLLVAHLPVVSSSSCLKTLTLPNNLLANWFLCAVAETPVRGFKEILEGKHDHLPGNAFRGVRFNRDVI